MRAIDDLAAEWDGEWLASLKGEIHDLHLRKLVHDELMEGLDRGGHGTSLFADLFHKMYLDSQVVAIRRQTDDDSRTLSLHRLFGQLEQAANQFTRSWYVNRWLSSVGAVRAEEREFHDAMANQAFDDFCDRPGARKLGRGRLQADRNELTVLTERVVEYANTHVAHTSRNRGQMIVTYADFEGAIAHLGEMLKRYYLLLNQGALISATPVIQGDALAALRQGLA